MYHKVFLALQRVFPKMHYEPIFWAEALAKLLFSRKADLVSSYSGEVLSDEERPLTLHVVIREFRESVLHERRRRS